LTATPKDLKTRLVAAQWLWKEGQLKDAAEQATAARQIDPKSIDAQMISGQIALFQKSYTAAENYFQAAHLLDPNNFGASNNLALALAEQKDDTKKQTALGYAAANADRYRNSAEAISTYGWVLYRLKRLEEAEQALRSVVAGGSFSTDTAYYWARIQADRGRDADAIKFLDGALQYKGPFVMRHEAEALLKELKKE
jgi:tetratricopeptide (TPR) repeat protein